MSNIKQYAQLLMLYLKPQKIKVAGLTILLVAGIATQLINPQILRNFINSALAKTSLDALTNLALLYISLIFVSQFILGLSSLLAEEVSWQATNGLRADLALHCLRLDMSFHKNRKPGELIERVDGDVSLLSNFFSQFVIRIAGNLLLFSFIIILIGFIDWRLGLALACFAFGAFFMVRKIQSLAVPHVKASLQASGEMAGFWEEHLNATEDIRANGAIAYAMQKFYKLMRVITQKDTKARVMGGISLNMWQVLFAFSYAIIFSLGAVLLGEKQLDLGTLYLIFNYTTILALNLTVVAEQLRDFQNVRAAIERIRDLYYTETKIKDTGKSSLPSGSLGLEFKNVSFEYTTDVPVLRNLSFKLEKGQTLGLLGRTGSGKTTITRLLFRFYDPNSGLIKLGEQELKDLGLRDLREKIGLVTQEVQLFQATVRDNLTFFNDEIKDEQILQIFKELGLLDWYKNLPNGLDTELTAGSSGLSAGESQLLAFARVFLQNPGLVILDEPSSRLDPVTERFIEEAIERLFQNRSGLIIAHRLKTIRNVDRILILDNGTILENGSRSELEMQTDSHFSKLLQAGMEDVLV